jgi:hypothetical protein
MVFLCREAASFNNGVAADAKTCHPNCFRKLAAGLRRR